MPESITIRDVPDDTRDELSARAALTGRSLEEYLRAALIEMAARPEVDIVVARMRARKAATGGALDSASILRHRDADRQEQQCSWRPG